MKKYQTIVIGAGPGGLSCATRLADSGRQVLLLERNAVIGPKVCAGGITHSGLLKNVPAELIECSFSHQHIFSNLQATVISSPTPIVSTVNRSRLGQWMLAKAAAAGVEIRTTAQVTEINADRLTLRGGEELCFDFLVGADGASSLVRKHLGVPTIDTGAGIHFEVEGDFDKMEWHLDAKSFNNGYAWIFPHQGLASVGVYGPHRTNSPAELLKKLRHWAAKRGINFDGLRPAAAVINFDYQGWRFGNMYLIGDAAGLTSGLTGEGIYPAIISGRAAAETIIAPEYHAAEMDRLLARHQWHRRLVALTSMGKISCRLITESLILALRMGIIDFKAIEMGE